MKFHIYQTKGMGKRGWRWRLTARNGRIVAASSQSFSSKQSTLRNVRCTRHGLHTADGLHTAGLLWQSTGRGRPLGE